VGDDTMNRLNAIFVLALAYLAVFLQASCDVFRDLLGAQVSLLPALMVYTSLSQGFPMVALLAVCGGLWCDSLSANPLGASVLPLFLIGLAIFIKREVLLRQSATAQLILGLGASALWPIGTLFLLLTFGSAPLLGWRSLWQWAVATVVGGALTPACFALFDRIRRAFDYPAAMQPAFRPDREIKRGRF
jgi:cell shape-determining protein MreD